MSIDTGLIVGFILGFISSILTWLFITKWLCPNIEISSNIAKVEYSGKIPMFKFRILNLSKRNVYNLSAFFRVHIKGYPTVEIKIFEENILPILKSKELCERSISVMNGKAIKEGRGKFGDKEIKEKFDNEQLNLDDIFELSDEVYAEVILFGYDEFSGTQKSFSKEYKKSHIVSGDFIKKTTKINPRDTETYIDNI
jgi:hypothetical protein